MNPVKYIIENKLEDEVRCLSRYGNSLQAGPFRNMPNRLGGEIMQTCDMLVLNKPGWRTYATRHQNAVWNENKPNMRKMDGTWVHKVCWDRHIYRVCCPKQCANAEPS